MCIKTLKYLLTNPPEAIELAKKEKNMNTAATLMIAEWIFLALAVLPIVPRVGAAIAVFTIGIILTLFIGLLVQVTFNVLGGKGDYKAGLTAVVYSLVPLSFGLLVSSLLLLVTFIGAVAAFLIVSVYAVISLATLYKATKELFKVDMITAWIGISIITLGVLIAIYAVSLGYLGITKIETLKGLITSAM